ncbi:MAG TPA: hypothetical protein VFV56_04570 [Gaiellaceae bacterium]|jgi:hypothetical protein|nr:hypothetical protein [Gaiellaceae bacterium]
MRTYEIRSGRRTITLREASTPQHAVIDYLKSMGCRDAEIVRLGTDGVAWRGARYTAVAQDTNAAA